MKTLIYAPGREKMAKQVKEWLEDFGRGLHVMIASDENETGSALKQHWSHTLLIGISDLPKGIVSQGTSKIDVEGKDLESEEDFAKMRHEVYVVYRDILSDMVGTRCTCGLYDICHCH